MVFNKDILIIDINRKKFNMIFFSYKKVNTKSICLAKYEENNQSNLVRFDLHDWRQFDFNSITKIKIIKTHFLFSISSLEKNCFFGFKCLEELDLSFIELTKIDSDTFKNLNTLKRLYLQENRIDQTGFQPSNGFPGLEKN